MRCYVHKWVVVPLGPYGFTTKTVCQLCGCEKPPPVKGPSEWLEQERGDAK